MAKADAEDLKHKKKRLEQELNNIQQEIDGSIDQVRHEMGEKINPKNIIREHPLPVVGLSAFVGFWVGYDDNGGQKSNDESGEFKRTLIYELKRLMTKKAISFVADMVERQFD